jgi:hypothetical protein
MASLGKKHPVSITVVMPYGERNTRSAHKVRIQDASDFLCTTSKGK